MRSQFTLPLTLSRRQADDEFPGLGSFEVYERSKSSSKELSVRVTLSEGAHSAVLDASLVRRTDSIAGPSRDQRELTSICEENRMPSMLCKCSLDERSQVRRKQSPPRARRTREIRGNC